MYLFVQNEFKWEPVKRKNRNVNSNATESFFSHKCIVSEQSIIKQGQHLSFLSTFSPKFCDLYGLQMQGGRKITWGQGGLGRYNLSQPLLCDNNSRDVHCTQLFIISDTSLTISLIDNVHSDIARWAETQIYLFHS